MKDRMKGKMAILGTVVCLFATMIMLGFMQTDTARAAATDASFSATFTCASGFPSGGCYKKDCMAEYGLNMNNNQYTLKFNAPRAADYKCTITAVTNDFSFNCGSPPYNPSVAEPNEKTQVILNDKVVGTTDDSYCNTVSECVHPPCVNNVPSDVGGLSNPTCFSGYSDSKFCKSGSVEFKIGNLIPDELNDARAGEGEDVRYVIFDMSNTRSRVYSGVSFVYFPDIDNYVVKTGVGTCEECSCCPCSEGAIRDGWCGEGITRGNSPTLEGNKKYKITWNSDAHSICIKKEGDDERCLVLAMPLSFEFNSYCLGNECQGKTQWHNVWAQKFTNMPVTLESFTCNSDVYSASQSCPGFSNGVVYNGNCGGGSTLKACGASCTIDSQCQSGTCTNYICYNCCGDGVCQTVRGETGANCRKDCGSDRDCDNDDDCDDCEMCVSGRCRSKIKCY
jgi:hypothetical protein